ncbi:MAG: molybdopterin molybdotransferase MoeA [Candidatus Promineifilaceae bacterium]|nr:molybdopterin molybdotransferase MoeA [Candidatus Promineifilaceae bacterium]
MGETEYLTVAEALQQVLQGVNVLPAENVLLLDALDRVLAQPVTAGDSLPPFANSSMDGYAVRAADVAGATRDEPAVLRVAGDVPAGVAPTLQLEPGEAARIMTGAPLPPGADSVIPVEDTNEPWRDAERPLPELIELYRSVEAGDYVRQPGEDVQAGSRVLPAGHVIRPQEIGLLASLGVEEVAVVRRPRVAVLATGDELIPIDQPLQPGKIRNSNRYTQTAQVLSAGGVPLPLGIAGDREQDVREKLQAGVEAGVDLFVSSAGVSVGAYDVVKLVLEREGNVRFWRVRMRPGKPLAYGTYEGVPYLGLPGNPVSAMVSFERFVRPAIRKMAGHDELEQPRVEVVMQDEIQSDGRETYARARVALGKDRAYTARLSGDQGSHVMTALVEANALVIVPEGVRRVAPGERLEAMLLR